MIISHGQPWGTETAQFVDFCVGSVGGQLGFRRWLGFWFPVDVMICTKRRSFLIGWATFRYSRRLGETP